MNHRAYTRNQQKQRWHQRRGYHRIRMRLEHECQHRLYFDISYQPTDKLKWLLSQVRGNQYALSQTCIEHWRRISQMVRTVRNKKRWYAWVRQSDYLLFALAWPTAITNFKIIDTKR